MHSFTAHLASADQARLERTGSRAGPDIETRTRNDPTSRRKGLRDRQGQVATRLASASLLGRRLLGQIWRTRQTASLQASVSDAFVRMTANTLDADDVATSFAPSIPLDQLTSGLRSISLTHRQDRHQGRPRARLRSTFRACNILSSLISLRCRTRGQPR